MFLIFCFFKKRYFFSFLFFFSILFPLFFIFGKRKFFFFYFLFVRCFINVPKNFQSFFAEKEESSQRRDWNSSRYFNPASNITRLSVLQEFQLLRLKLSGSFKHSEFHPLLRRYRFEQLRRKFRSGVYSQTFPSPTLRNLHPWEWWNLADRKIRLWDYLGVIPDEY